jgi:UDP-glucose 4-epimerase
VSSGPAEASSSTGLRILVTGGSGFIGRHVVAQLRSLGATAVVADKDEFPDGAVPAVTGDLCDPQNRERAVTADLDAIVHLAAATSVLGSIERPAEVHRTNVEMTAGLLELARCAGVETFVLASTNAVVGNVGQSTITETLPLAPLTPYGATKAAGEMLLSGYAGAFGMRTPAVRLTNVYGPGMGHKDSFVPRLMRAAARGGEVEIYGDGEQRRDLVHVFDAAQALVTAARSWPAGPVIIGGSRSYTVNQLAQAARDATGRPIAARRVAAKPGEMPAVVVDIARARGRGYAPSISLVDGMRSAWADFAGSSVGRDADDAGR